MLTLKEVTNIPRKVFIKPTLNDMCTCCCNQLIEEHPDIRYRIKGQQVTSDCYFKYIGNYVDNNPINTPRDIE